MALWNGFEIEEFEFEGNNASIVFPKGERCGKWLLKTEYRDAFPGFEIEMLKRGWCVAFNQNPTRWALEEEIDTKARFCAYISKTYGLDMTCVPVGMSCGGQIAVKLAAKYPHLISCLYLDAPVMNYLSCPCGLGARTSFAKIYAEFVYATGMTVLDLINYREHPIDKVDTLIANQKPVIMVYGDIDDVVPYAENGAFLEKKYKEQGAILEVYGKQGCNHHPHGLEDPTPIINFVEKYA